MADVYASNAVQQHDWQCPICRLAARARDSHFVMPNNPLIVAALQAICAGGANATTLDGGWRRDRTGAPVYEFWNGAGGRIVARVDMLNPNAAWAQVKSYSSLTLDCAVALLSGLSSDPFRQIACAPRRESVVLGAALVLNAKGYRRYGVERTAFAGAIAAEFDKLERLRFELIAYPAFDPVKRRWKSEGVSRDNIALVERATDDRWAPANYEASSCAFSRPLRLGAWAEHWLNGAGPMWTARVPEAILELDHRENRSAEAVAKRIALIVALSFAAARDAKEIRLSVRQLMRRIGLLPRLGATRPAHSGRIADRLEEALLRLSEQGLVKSRLCGEAASALRAANRRWFDEWLEAAIVFERP